MATSETRIDSLVVKQTTTEGHELAFNGVGTETRLNTYIVVDPDVTTEGHLLVFEP
jgi:hypothetical protein